MRRPNNAVLVRIACGDAGALPVEYVKPHDPVVAQTLRFDRYYSHPTHGNRAGKYSDDAEMSAGNTHVLVGDFTWTELGFAQAWLQEFARGNQRKGYSRGFQALLEVVGGNAPELLRRLRKIDLRTNQPHNRSNKNGAAMRSVPFGTMPNIAEMLDLVGMQAAITHDTPEGIFSARAVALMSHYALYEHGPVERMGRWCVDRLPPSDRRFAHTLVSAWTRGRVESSRDLPVGLATVWAVADLLVRRRSLMGILRQVIEWGGDTDSVAAIAWGIASTLYQDEILPEFFERDLECGNPHTGTPYLLALGTRLMTTFAR